MKYRDLIQFDPGAETIQPADGASAQVRLMATRLVAKTPAQAVQVREHLLKFAHYYGSMNGRLDEFVALFPIHPDCLTVLEKLPFLKPLDIGRWLEKTLRAVLEESVPVNEPGLIGYDHFWAYLSRQPDWLSVPAVEAVVYCSKNLQATMDKSWSQPDWQPAAKRILHALLVHRLTTIDIYHSHGLTPAQLCDALCLPPLGAEKAGGNPAETLSGRVIDILGEIRRVAGEKPLEFHPINDEYSVHIRKFKRFIKPEICLHWMNAAPFMLLLLTGGIMLASRFWQFERETWVLIHEICAATWVIALPLTVLVHVRIHWEFFRSLLIWGRDDLLWMTQSPRSLLNKKITPPPAGRFNPGQKINALLVFVYFFGFGTTGLLMFFKGSILFPWYAHTALFFSALGSVGGHLHLALLNPSTRIALAGIFHGWAPIEYIKHHHPLSLPASAHSHHAAPGRKTLREELLLSKVEIVILVITILLAGLGALAFHQARLASVRSAFSKKFADSISPNELSTRHRIGPLAESCTKCHAYTGQIPDANCEQCHVDIRERRTHLTGYHGTFKGECRTCHREHPVGTNSIIPAFREKFNHDLTRYRLEGKHGRVECDDCHKKLHAPVPPDAPITAGIYYLGLKSEHCTDCHQDQHHAQFTAACEKCHTSAGWTGKELKFSHAVDSSYPLIGKHAAVDCAKCHKPNPPGAALGTALFKGLSPNCTACHQDPHKGQFTAGCETCHTPASWKRDALKFDHNKDSKYPLVARHAAVACEKCHRPAGPEKSLASALFRGLKTECADCHADPHRGQFERNCIRCHPEPDGWTGKQLRFRHNQDSQFHLDGRHASVECVKCHPPQPRGSALSSAKFKGLGLTCAACHPVKHPEDYGTTCVSCHAIDKWIKTRPGSEHILRHEIKGEPLVEKHLAAKCNACHNPERVDVLGITRTARFDCVTCHQGKEDPHRGTLGGNCTKCHAADAWKGDSLKFNHNTMTSYGLNQDHKNVACVKCHADNHWKPLNTTCIGCHPKFTGTEKSGQPIETQVK